jgi:chromosome partitioning protein
MAASKKKLAPATAPVRPAVIVCTSPKGGVGKGTIVQAIAVGAAMEGLRVALIDYDPQRSSLKWLQRRLAVGEVAPIAGKGGTWAGVRDELAEAAAAYDIVCVDTPTAVEDHIVEVDIILRAADYVLIPTGPQFTDRESTKPWMTVIRGRTQKVAFVLNRVNRQTRSLRDAKMDLLGVGKLCPVEIPLYEDIHLQQEPGFSVAEIADAKGYEELLAVWNFVKAEMGMP